MCGGARSSTRLKTNSTGDAIYSSNYEPFDPSNGESGSEDYRYTGKQEDPSGLYYFGARYYNPVLGRFITRDTVFGDLTDPQSQNRYVYCMNNPHKYTDPNGNRAVSFTISGDIGASIPSRIIYGVKAPTVGGKIKGEIGFVIVSDMEGTWDFGWTASSGTGFMTGAEISLSVKGTVYPDIKEIETLNGESVDVEIQLGQHEIATSVSPYNHPDQPNTATGSYSYSFAGLGGGSGGGVVYKKSGAVSLFKFKSPWYRLRDAWYSLKDNWVEDSTYEYNGDPQE